MQYRHSRLPYTLSERLTVKADISQVTVLFEDASSTGLSLHAGCCDPKCQHVHYTAERPCGQSALS